MSGLRANPDKSLCFFCNVPSDIVNFALSLSGFQQGTLPIKYLGLPLITSTLTTSDCAPLVQRLCARIDSWTTKFLRHTGRLQLIKAVLFNIQGYWSAYVFLPKGVLKTIQSYLARFLWGGKYNETSQHKVAWSDCCLKKEEGGLGIRDLFEWNRAAILFQVWRIAKPNPTSLWILWIHQCLFKNKVFWTAKIPYKCPWNLRKILNMRRDALQFVSYTIGPHSQFRLWHDPWLIQPSLLSYLGTSIVSIMESNNMAYVNSIISNGIWSPSGSNHVQAIELRHLLASCRIGTEDVVLWNGQKHVSLSIVWDSLRRRGSPPPWLGAIWHQFHIPKCAFFTWLALRQRLLTKEKMLSFGIRTDPNCVLCNNHVETTAHLFSSCQFTLAILRASPVPISLSWDLWLQGNFFQNRPSNLMKHVGYLYFSVVIYLVWQERNNRIHQNGRAKQNNELIESTKRMMREKLFTCKNFQRNSARNPHLSHILY